VPEPVLELELAKDEEGGFCSIFHLFMGSYPPALHVESVTLFWNDWTPLDRGVALAAGFEFAGARYLFLDSIDFSGIVVGDRQAADEWLTYYARLQPRRYVWTAAGETDSDAIGDRS
jgi:hypothetical protein